MSIMNTILILFVLSLLTGVAAAALNQFIVSFKERRKKKSNINLY
jgi:hypothetical protein